MPAVVDFVASGSRFKIYIPKQEVKITLVLAGIRAPRTARNAQEKPEPFGQEAYDFAVRKTLQRDVEVTIQDNDRSGGFIGTMSLNKTENFAIALVREGLATVNDYSIAQSALANELRDAEEEAKLSQKNLWANYDAEADAASKAANGHTSEPAKATTDIVQIMVSDIRTEPFGISIQILKDGGIPELEKMMAEFSIHHRNAAVNPTGFSARNGEIVSAKFSADGVWYRAKVIRSNQQKKSAEVQFVDYGNKETLSFANLRPLPDQFRKLDHQSRDALLSFIQPLAFNSDYGTEVFDRLHGLVDGLILYANIDYREPGPNGALHLTVYETNPTKLSDISKSVNAQMVRDGYARVAAKSQHSLAYPEAIKAIRQAHEEARRSHAGALQYGDFDDDD